ncbi:hypothetical protein AAF712_012927 [Marasmius tenuissimus]|uniref:Uncharacterized protein n=1 Tax=Marasmius tenuissimus TaxID=585030 RepID=A0ABR2ZGJ6_9AGAR
MAANSLLIPALPAANMAILAATLANPATAESAVNGAWNAILNNYFPQPGFIIKPEVRVPNAGDSDLVVQSQAFAGGAVTWTWRVCYEGKAPGAETWLNIRSQVSEYPRRALANGAWCWCIGGMGRSVSFWRFRKGDMIDVKPVDVYRGNVRVQDTAGMPPVYDIVNDQVAIDTIMRYIVINP